MQKDNKNQALNNSLEPNKKFLVQIKNLQNKIKRLEQHKVDQPDDSFKGYIKTVSSWDRQQKKPVERIVYSYLKCCKVLDALKKVGDTTHNYASFSHWKLNETGYYADKPEIEIKVKQRLADNLSRIEAVLDYWKRRKTIFCQECVSNLVKEGIICQWGSNWMWEVQKEREDKTREA